MKPEYSGILYNPTNFPGSLVCRIKLYITVSINYIRHVINIAHIEKYQRTQQQVVCYLVFANAIVLKTAMILTVQNLSWEVVAYQTYHRCF
jgi:hypothetical protein